MGDDVQIICEPSDDATLIIDPDVKPVFTHRAWLKKLHYIPQLSSTLRLIGDADIYHIQGIWMLHGWQVARYANKISRPYVVTLRGMLYPQSLTHNPLIKRISLSLYQREVLANAAAVQCTCREEAEHYRALGFKNPIVILPNPIETRGIIESPIPPKDVLQIGYLGRVHPRKRIERLIHAFDNISQTVKDLNTNVELVIIGGGDTDYERFLKDEVSRLSIKNVRFTGFLTGADKHKAISQLSVLVVPSDFENFGNIVTEALVRGVPVIASRGTPWRALEENNCGYWVSNDQQTLEQTICKFISLPESERMTMAQNGRTFVSSVFSVQTLGKKMHTLYNWILGKEDKPDFVDTL